MIELNGLFISIDRHFGFSQTVDFLKPWIFSNLIKEYSKFLKQAIRHQYNMVYQIITIYRAENASSLSEIIRFAKQKLTCLLNQKCWPSCNTVIRWIGSFLGRSLKSLKFVSGCNFEMAFRIFQEVDEFSSESRSNIFASFCEILISSSQRMLSVNEEIFQY